jgi:hypothetical protein
MGDRDTRRRLAILGRLRLDAALLCQSRFSAQFPDGDFDSFSSRIGDSGGLLGLAQLNCHFLWIAVLKCVVLQYAFTFLPHWQTYSSVLLYLEALFSCTCC